MGLRINTNIAAANSIRNLKGTGGLQERSMERLASGKRINKAMDDVAGLSISESISGQVRAMGQAEKNAQNGISFLQVGEGGLAEFTNILNRIREVSTQAASDTIGERERGFVDVEVQHLKQELERIAQTTEFSGTKLLDGSGKELTFQVGMRGSDNDRIFFDFGKISARLSDLKLDNIKVTDKAGARDALDKIDAAITKTGEYRANFGALQSRLSSTINNIVTFKDNLDAARSRMADADIAEESANLAKASVMQQAGTATLAQANGINNLALKLI